MSASHLVDLGPTCDLLPSVNPANLFPASGATIGNAVDLLHAHGFTNLLVYGALSQSGRLRVAVQTSDTTTSGDFTDPTSGRAAADLPFGMASGGIVWVNSGAGLLSGFIQAVGFLRPHRYARANVLSGDFWQAIGGAGFVCQKHVVGSGGGFTFAPGSGSLSV